MKPDLIIFDKDGTLIDNIKLFMPVVESAIKKLENKVESKKKFHQFIKYNPDTGELLPESFVLSQPLEVTVNKVSKKFDLKPEYIFNSFDELKFNKKTVVPYVNLKKLFSTLKNKGIKIAINTSDRRSNTEKCIKILEIEKYLDMVVCGDDGLKTKPSPSTINYICQELGVSNSKTFMVGDTQADIDAGIRANCGGIFLVREDEEFHKFKNYGVHIKNVDQIKNYI